MKGFFVVIGCLFATSEAAKLVFNVIGDWGTGKDEQKQVAAAMGAWSQTNSPSFTVSVGDNFYEWGVSSETDSEFDTSWKYMYNHPALQHTWYVVAGNHDHYFNRAHYQVRHHTVDSRWYFPALYYSFYKHVGTKSIHFVAFDTERGRHDDKMISWLENELRTSKGDWIFVIGHHPVASSGQHGVDEDMIKKVQPLFQKYKVAVFFTGHDHDLEHINRQDGSEVTEHVISGAGGKSRGKCSACAADVKARGYASRFFTESYGFVGVEMTETELTLRYIDNNQKEIYTYKMQNPRSRPTSVTKTPQVDITFRQLNNIVSMAATVRQTTVGSVEECTEDCKRHASFCHGFSYNIGRHTCSLKNKGVLERSTFLFSPGTNTFLRQSAFV